MDGWGEEFGPPTPSNADPGPQLRAWMSPVRMAWYSAQELVSDRSMPGCSATSPFWGARPAW
jgi:hypothetical protein